jgi:hypothetical protein
MDANHNEDETDEGYLRESELLLERIRMREEMVQILKFATLDKTAGVRDVIARLDKSIEATEHILELYDERRRLTRECEIQDQKTLALAEKMMAGLRKHLAENEPEKLELLDAILEDEGKSH